MSAPPTPPAEEKKKGKENFWFLLPRPQGADEARIIHFVQNRFGFRQTNAPKKSFHFSFSKIFDLVLFEKLRYYYN
ncbi:hypothetical protein COS61_02275 [Candidatus Wolfebacteria bacterium CG03_land_8_20_14_0_80_40_12]|uniref:Uncharacterized protein n=1 Tax=Candidatus Wolfebacteria bacterium CG03_land_8_20_14_0_80_40_12 TaxID=1975069 RepID=A0A2M7B567_9BACT|nr:MAG: hypothetical protein COS61_02275 [Candidatus Wolfebacteria bacterium CG03_land_8_20_14_0_80_40_12]